MRNWTLARGTMLLVMASLLILPATVSAKSSFHPRIGHAMGLFPLHVKFDLASGEAYPVAYHGGSVMRPPVTVHAVFWAPPGYSFPGSPGPGIPSYGQRLQELFADAAHDSGATANVFSILTQYGDGTGPGGYGLQFSAAGAIADSDPYPKRSDQCASPSGIGSCVTDTQLGSELNSLISRQDPSGRGLHDLWFVFLPPGVDECIQQGSCGTNQFAGYHSVTDRGQGAEVYAVIPYPTIEGPVDNGTDPSGNPDADMSVDVSSHELVEAITDPLGTGWIDPNGLEVADKCENGPQVGSPLGFAADGSPYDNVIAGDQYLLQEMWSNKAGGCVQSNALTSGSPTLPRIYLRQFSPVVSGNIGVAKAGVPVRLLLLRHDTPVARAGALTRADGSWGPVAARGLRAGVTPGFGDDRDAVLVAYGPGGPAPDLIATGSGGDPFTEAGYTGWYDLDSGVYVAPKGVAVAPCGQVGVLSISGISYQGSPEALCNGETNVAAMRSSAPVTAARALTLTSVDNRAESFVNPGGALVGLSVGLGEPGSVGVQQTSSSLIFVASGIPACSADLRAQRVSCDGLVAGARYRLVRARGNDSLSARASQDGVASFGGFAVAPGTASIRGGDRLRLFNRAGRTLTTLHVAHLRVAVDGEQTVLAGGSCQPGEYYGPPLTAPPVSDAGIGSGGATGTGTICPLSGLAKGLPASLIEQSDDLSGGLTRTEVPALNGEAPGNDATVYGPFTAVAQAGIPGPHGSTIGVGAPVSVTIARAGSGTVAFHAANVDTSGGVSVSGLAAGVYTATWTVHDANGDTRTLLTRFVQAG